MKRRRRGARRPEKSIGNFEQLLSFDVKNWPHLCIALGGVNWDGTPAGKPMKLLRDCVEDEWVAYLIDVEHDQVAESRGMSPSRVLYHLDEGLKHKNLAWRPLKGHGTAEFWQLCLWEE